MPVTVGSPVPALPALSETLRAVPASAWTVLFFFPRGSHPHCVMEARRFQHLLPDFERLGVRVIGISVDTDEQQRYFRSFCTLSFPLISDSSHELSEAFGVLQAAEYEGERVTFARRESFLLRPNRQVAYHWTEVDPNMHAAQVLEMLRQVV